MISLLAHFSCENTYVHEAGQLKFPVLVVTNEFWVVADSRVLWGAEPFPHQVKLAPATILHCITTYYSDTWTLAKVQTISYDKFSIVARKKLEMKRCLPCEAPDHSGQWWTKLPGPEDCWPSSIKKEKEKLLRTSSLASTAKWTACWSKQASQYS